MSMPQDELTPSVRHWSNYIHLIIQTKRFALLHMCNLRQELLYRKQVNHRLSNSEISRNVKKELVKTTQNIPPYLRKLVECVNSY